MKCIGCIKNDSVTCDSEFTKGMGFEERVLCSGEPPCVLCCVCEKCWIAYCQSGKCSTTGGYGIMKKYNNKYHAKSWACKEVFITFRPPKKEATVENILGALKKIKGSVRVLKCFGQIEKFTKGGEHIHGHMVCEIDKLNAFKFAMKDRVKPAWDFQYNNSGEIWYQDKIDYMNGSTKDDEKNLRKEQDRIWREINSISPIEK